MSKDILNDFMEELTSLCDKYHLWVEGENIRVEDDNGNLVGSFMSYSDKQETYTAQLVGEPGDLHE
jgi:hypothetical protein